MKIVKVIAIAMLLSTTVGAQVATDETSGTCGDNLKWEFDGTTIHISGSGAMTNFTTRYIGPQSDQATGNTLTNKEKAKIRKKELTAKSKANSQDNYRQDDLEHLVPWHRFNEFVTTIIVDEGVTTIGDNAFKGFKELSKVVLPRSIEVVGRESFYWCVKLDSIFLPNATIISVGAFSNCYNLKTISLGKNLTTIEQSAFYQCKGLHRVDYNGDVNSWFAIDFKSENSNPLKYAGRLYIDNKLVTEISVPQAISVIPPYVCIGMTSLRTLRLHEGVKKIGPHSFDGCRFLNTIVARSQTPPTLERFAFLNTDIRNVYLSTDRSKEAYQESWGKRYTYKIGDKSAEGKQ